MNRLAVDIVGSIVLLFIVGMTIYVLGGCGRDAQAWYKAPKGKEKPLYFVEYRGNVRQFYIGGQECTETNRGLSCTRVEPIDCEIIFNE